MADPEYILKEKLDSRNVEDSRDGLVATRLFIAEYDESVDPDKGQEIFDTEALQLSGELLELGVAHPTLPDLFLKNISLAVNVEALNRGIVTYTYQRIDRAGNQGGSISTPDENGEIWTFNMVSQSTTINAVKTKGDLPQQKTWDSTNTGAQIDSALNHDDDSVSGIEVYRPAETVNVTKVYSDYTDVNQAYRNTLRKLQNTINDSSWPSNGGWSAGMLLFLGADISYNLAEGSATVNYSFQSGSIQKEQEYKVWAAIPTVAEKTRTITIPKLYPFQVVWAQLDRKVLGEKPDQNPYFNLKSINVADVYEYGDFSELQIVGA